jgi:cytochrome c
MGRVSTHFGITHWRLTIACAGAMSALAFSWSPANAAGDAARGEVLYQGCQDCHSIEKNDVGPMHKGVVGRAAGTVPGYNYSPALRNKNCVDRGESRQMANRPAGFYPSMR